MNEELTNLLPSDRKKQLQKEYTKRLVTISVWAVSFLLITFTILQLPLLVFEIQDKQSNERELALLSAQLSNSGNTEASARLKVLNENLSYLSRLSTTTTGSEIVTSVTNAPHAGIHITGVSYSTPTKGVGGRVVLIGVATTRQTLQAYTDTLENLLRISVDLPISAYAKESDIPFSITLSGFF